MKKFLLLLLFILFTPVLFAKDLNDFSENKKIYLDKIELFGNKNLSKDDILEIMKLKEQKSFFIYEIEQGIASLISSGFFKDTSYQLIEKKDAYELIITVAENPPLASLKVIDDRMLDLTILKEKIKKTNLLITKTFSHTALEKAIDDFNIYNQAYGIFLYNISYKELTKDEIKKEGGTILYENSELERDGIHVVIYIKEIPRMKINKIKMLNTTISYDEILNFLVLSESIWIENDRDLFFRYKRLKRLGFYDSIYFKIIPENAKELSYTLIIIVQEIPTAAITTTLTAPANIGIITAVEYYNISVFNTLQRFRIGAGWELALSSPTFILEYTEPYFWKGFFLDFVFQKSDTLDLIKTSSNRKFTNNYDLKATIGANVYHNLFAYIFHKERYSLVSTLDSDNESVPNSPSYKNVFHSSGIIFLFDSLDDNFFITQGMKVSADYEFYWREQAAHKIGFSAEVYVPIPIFNLITAATTRSNILLTDPFDKQTTLELDIKMRTNVQEITTQENQQNKFTNYTSLEARFPIPEIKGIVKDLSFVIFMEAGGAWADINAITLDQVRYGFGIGFRLSPRQHYSSFLFQFPAGLYLGYRTGDKKAKVSLTSHRDDFYYINLTASF